MAKIKGACPHCGEEGLYASTAAGLHVACPECGGRFQLDYLRPRRGCFSSCLTVFVALLLLGVAAAGLAVSFSDHWPPFLRDMHIVKEPAPPPATIPDERPAPPPEAESKPVAEGPAGSGVFFGHGSGDMATTSAEKDSRPLGPTEPDAAPDPEHPKSRFQPRVWTDRTGTFTVTATLVSMLNDQARLRKEDGEILEVSVEQLSAADRAYLKEQLRRVR
ncbi:MAG: hypothetical protein KY475_20745 [Planctomycetes bacterium]|nr:hypothetical protein [Planctomycetota bacterium]